MLQQVSCSEVESEFWRLTRTIGEDVTVLYGADIHVLTNGSGFPTVPGDDSCEEDEVTAISTQYSMIAFYSNHSLLFSSATDFKVTWVPSLSCILDI